MIRGKTNIFYRLRLQFMLENLSLRHFYGKRSVRLGVRTSDFHSGNTGSIPVRTTKAAQTSSFFYLLRIPVIKI